LCVNCSSVLFMWSQWFLHPFKIAVNTSKRETRLSWVSIHHALYFCFSKKRLRKWRRISTRNLLNAILENKHIRVLVIIFKQQLTAVIQPNHTAVIITVTEAWLRKTALNDHWCCQNFLFFCLTANVFSFRDSFCRNNFLGDYWLTCMFSLSFLVKLFLQALCKHVKFWENFIQGRQESTWIRRYD
jgi:hypothetical protein